MSINFQVRQATSLPVIDGASNCLFIAPIWPTRRDDVCCIQHLFEHSHTSTRSERTSHCLRHAVLTCLQENPIFATILMDYHLDAHLIEALAASPSLLKGPFRLEGTFQDPKRQPATTHTGVSVLHLALASCEDEIRAVLAQLVEEAHELAVLAKAPDSTSGDGVDRQSEVVLGRVRERGHVTVDDVLQQQRAQRSLTDGASTYEGTVVAGCRLVSTALEERASQDAAGSETTVPEGVQLLPLEPVSEGPFAAFERALRESTAVLLARSDDTGGGGGDTGRDPPSSSFFLTRNLVLELQDAFSLFYAHALVLSDSNFGWDELYLRTPANQISWLHLCARQRMPRTLITVINHVLTHINPAPAANQGVSSYRFIANMLSAGDAWTGRTPLHFAALYVHSAHAYEHCVHSVHPPMPACLVALLRACPRHRRVFLARQQQMTSTRRQQ